MNVQYRIYLIKRPGVYFISKSVKGAFKRDGCFFKIGVYWPCLLQTLAQQSAVIILFLAAATALKLKS